MRPSDRVTPTPALNCDTAEHTIDSVAGDFNLDPANPANSLSKLEANQWGATLVTSFTNTDPGDDTVWFKIPGKNNPSTIKQAAAATAATGESQALTFGAKVDYSLPATAAGNEYQNTTVITATSNDFTAAAPTITSVTPDNGSVGEGTEIIIAGTNLDTAYQVFIDLDGNGNQNPNGSENCTNANIDSSTQITCTTPAETTANTYDVVVKTWGGVATDGPNTGGTGYTYGELAPSAVCQSGNEARNLCQVDLDANMIPVEYTGTTGTTGTPEWTTVSPTATGGQWYDYEQQQWANAVTVKSAELLKYQNQPGTIVDEDDVLGYWVYIPRYAYQVKRLNSSNAAIGTPGLFNIVFQKKGSSTTSTCGSASTPGSTTKCYPTANNQWATHPAFTFGTAELNGLWVGKFETSAGTTTNPSSDTNARANVQNGNIFVKPNQYSFRALNPASQFKLSRLMGPISSTDKAALAITTINNQTVTLPASLSNGNYMNLAGNETEINTRMAKNDDWGAIAYLSASIYGTGVSVSTTEPGASDNSNPTPGLADGGIRINANSNYVTGCGPTNDAGSTGTYGGGLTCTSGSNKSYYTELGQLASTTKNVYGIYDMSGGTSESVMAV
jgi:hypothetical protein